MTIVIALIKLHYPEIYAHLKSLGIPIDWYFYDALSSFYATTFSSDLVLRLWDMIFLSSSDDELKKRALWYLLVIPIYMLEVNKASLLTLQCPLKIKQLLLDTSDTRAYSPFTFVPELLVLIKRCFVLPSGRLSQIIKTDNTYRLEELRREVERGWAEVRGEELKKGEATIKEVKMGDRYE
jgi:hypothetical protein